MASPELCSKCHQPMREGSKDELTGKLRVIVRPWADMPGVVVTYWVCDRCDRLKIKVKA